MTKKQALAKIKVLLNQKKLYIIQEAERLLNSGAIDLDSWENDFLLPRAILYVAMENISDIGIASITKPTIENLKNF